MATTPYDVGFPVNFYSGGDTTKDAFNKHIQEIKRIYGIINAINADKISAQEVTDKLNAHINSSNPHPNLDLSNTKGELPFSRVSGSLDLSRTTGNLDGSRISGTLSSSVIPMLSTSKISGLEDFVKSKSGGITDKNISKKGYVEFDNGLIMQWGNAFTEDTVFFPVTFRSAVFGVVATEFVEEGTQGDGFYCMVGNCTKSSFVCGGIRPDDGGREWLKGLAYFWVAFGK